MIATSAWGGGAASIPAVLPLLLALSEEAFEPTLSLSASATVIADAAHPSHPHVGAGGSVTVLLVPHWLEAEVVSHLLTNEGGHRVATDAMLRKPFVITPTLQPYVGLGGTWLSLSSPEDSGNYFGAASVLGLDLWANHRFGFFVEANYNLVSHHRLVHEIGLAAGAMVAVF